MNIKQLSNKSINAFSLMTSGLLMIGIGMIFLFEEPTLIFAIKSILNLLTVFFVVVTLSHFINLILKRNKTKGFYWQVLNIILNGLVPYFVGVYPKLVLSLISVFFGAYALIVAIVRLLVYFQYKSNKVSGRIFVLASAFIFFGFSILIFSNPLSALLPISKLIGMFFILYGLTFLSDALHEGLSLETKNSFKRRIRISLPVFMVALVPHKVLTQINKALEVRELDQDEFKTIKENVPYDLEVLVHVAEKGTSAFGHVDIAFEGKVMTYGAYDEDTYHLKGAIADGVFIEIVNKDEYIKFSQNQLNKTLFGFGLKLDKLQKMRIREKIADIHTNLVEWHPKSQEAKLENKYIKGEFKDYASIVYDNLNGRFYKFIKGPFKTYFVLNTNCVLLADHIVGQSGIDAVKMRGLISPGTYFDFLNHEFSMKNSIVIARTVYHASESGEPQKSNK